MLFTKIPVVNKLLSLLMTMYKKIEKIINPVFHGKKIIWIILISGIIFRISQYLFNRSLWLDESHVALNIVNKNYLNFLEPLDYHQGAPFGFLAIEKFFIQIFGNTDLVLRLFPLIAGILSLFLFYMVATFFLERRACLIAFGLFSISDPLIYYSSELKQYSSDVTVFLIILLIVSMIIKKKSNFYFILLAVSGAVLIWFSHPTIFAITGVGLSLGVFYLLKKDKISFIKLLVVISIWFISFSIFYFVSLKFLANDRYMANFWSGSFIASNPTHMSFFDWYLKETFGIFEYPTGAYFPGLACIAFIVGLVVFFKTKKLKLAILYFPILITAIASILHMYPFSGRLILFMVPVFLILIGEGISELFNIKFFNTNLLGILVLFLLFIHPLTNDLKHLIHPRTRDEIKPVMQYLSQNRKKGDTIFLYALAENAFKYYAPKYNFSQQDFIVDKLFKGSLENLNRFRGTKRFWILFSHISPFKKCGKDTYLSYLELVGKKLKSFSSAGASVYLFDLSSP